MKKAFASLMIVSALVACKNAAEKTSDPVDSLEERLDTLKSNVDSTTDAKIDSLKERKDELNEQFDSTIEAKKDSLKK